VGPRRAGFRPIDIWTLAYLCFAALTVFVLRHVAIEPGSWLSRRTIRRTIVALIVLACVALLAVPGNLLGAVDAGFISPNQYAKPKQPQPTNCSVSADSTDFEMVATQVCAQQGHADTVRLATQARVSPGFGGLFERTIKLAVVIGAKGRVIHLG